MSNHFSLMIHGGAGALEHIIREGSDEAFSHSIYGVLRRGRRVLEQGGAALDAVELCAALLEDDPLYNAGRGSVLNHNGKVEMDAAIMNGSDLEAGAIAGVQNIKNPICLARQVLEQSEHVMLISEGAMAFAKAINLEHRPNEYFLTEARISQWEDAKAANRVFLDHEDSDEPTTGRLPQPDATRTANLAAAVPSTDSPEPQRKFGTIGAVAKDIYGNLAAATSTGGIVNKRWGRVGDSPIVGAGVFADNETCAVSATGYGEQFLRTVLAKTIADLVYFQGMDARQAAAAGMDYLVAKVKGLGGVIVIDRVGRCGSGHSTSGMIYGWIENGGEAYYRLS